MSALPDFITSVQASWNGTGEPFYRCERRALCILAGLEADYSSCRWDHIPPSHRERLLGAFRLAVDFGKTCASLIVQSGRT